ncbi:MAG: ATP-binding protein [Planctomycetes bacterium]|nr:ATP-binding protein [Planctomycetota bacterium]
MSEETGSSIIAVDRFIFATRDSGYKGTESAIAELVDNSLQAGARHVNINIAVQDEGLEYPLRVSVLDDGCGMDKNTLRQALRFGGSSRFNDRSGLGRYGMGLPNSSLSQARRVEVYSWLKPGSVLHSYLDVDEIAKGVMTEVPDPKPATLAAWVGKVQSPTGTLVVWTRCDRLDHRRVSTIARKLAPPLGRIFRYYLWGGVTILINGSKAEPFDPLYLHENSPEPGAQLYGKPIEYTVEARGASGAVEGTGTVVITFSELPVRTWHQLSNEEKRQLGVINGAGVSVVRAKREIDFGWFFMGSKRRENYDDWWRCEIRFDPILDEAFGITHTKQQIRPQDYLLDILSNDLENLAKALNGRVRHTHLQVRAVDRTVEVERLASEKDQLLKPLPKALSTEQEGVLDNLKKRHPSLRDVPPPEEGGALQYRIVQDSVKDTSFFTYAFKDGLLVLVVNPEHPFYKKLYKPLIENETKENRELRSQIDLLLLAAARAEAAVTHDSQREALAQFRKVWSDNVATFLLG